MNSLTLTFLGYTLLAIFIQALFSLFEMATVSFNKIRLQYYVNQKNRRAIWLNYLLNRPSRLFGATLIGVNTALQVGSECSRRFYESLNIDPVWAPLTQTFLVVILAELAPLFAARRHPEQLAMFFVPLMFFIAKVLTPLILAFDAFSRLIHRLMGKSEQIPLFISRDEVKQAFEGQEEDEFNLTTGNVFSLKSLKAYQLMTPLEAIHSAPSNVSVGELRSLLSIQYAPFIPVYHRTRSNIVAVLLLRDLLSMENHRRALEHARSPWFVPQETSVLEILSQFRRNNQSVAIILDPSGKSIGLLTLDDILDEIFGMEEEEAGEKTSLPSFYVERTLDGDMLVSDFNFEFRAYFEYKEGETLSDFLLKKLEHPPVKGEVIRVDTFLFTVIEPSLLGAKTLSVRSFQE